MLFFPKLSVMSMDYFYYKGKKHLMKWKVFLSGIQSAVKKLGNFDGENLIAEGTRQVPGLWKAGLSNLCNDLTFA